MSGKYPEKQRGSAEGDRHEHLGGCDFLLQGLYFFL